MGHGARTGDFLRLSTLVSPPSGGVAGGVIGHQVGSDRGKDAATIGGALLGGLIGNRVENDRREDRASEDFDLNNCRTVASNGETLQGYDVRYAYNGREYTARMASDPGRRLVLGRAIREDGTPYDYASGPPTAHNAHNRYTNNNRHNDNRRHAP